jgi:ABC-type lipoprotein export system ATPase subunit
LDQVLKPILRAEKVSCARALQGEEWTRVLDVSLTISPQSFTIVGGPVGCGKNLLVRLLGLLETPDHGEVFLHGAPTAHLEPAMRAGIRNQHFGLMFADPFLLPSLSVTENVAMPLLKISAASAEEARTRSEAVLDFVGLHGASETPVDSLTLWEQHCVSLARALVNKPELLLAENLPAKLLTAEHEQMNRLLRRALDELGVTVVTTAAANATNARIVKLAVGRVVSDATTVVNC